MRQEIEQQHEQVPEQGYRQDEIRRSLWLVALAWVFGAAFAAIVSGVAITSFLTKFLHTDPFTYGLIMAIGPAASLFFFLGSYVNERTGRVKRIFLIYATLHRLLWLCVAVVALLSPGVASWIKSVLVGVVIFISTAMANFGGAGWSTWMSAIVPKRLAGRFFAMRSSLGMISMILASTGAAFVLDRFHDAGWLFALIFAVAAILGAIDILIFIPVREIPRPVEATPPSMLEIVVTPWRDATFRAFTLFNAVAFIGYVGMGPFLWRYCFTPVSERGLGLNLSLTNLYLFILPLLAQAVVAPYWGRAIDRFGPKPVLMVSAAAAFILPLGWVVMHRELLWIAPIMVILGGLTWPGVEQTIMYMQVKGFPDARRTAYNAAFQVVFSLATMVGVALCGALAAFCAGRLERLVWLPAWVTPYHAVFLACIIVRAAAFFWLLVPISLPGTARMTAVTRAITTDISTSVTGAIKRVRRRRKTAR